jgi:hypothetical protein
MEKNNRTDTQILSIITVNFRRTYWRRKCGWDVGRKSVRSSTDGDFRQAKKKYKKK